MYDALKDIARLESYSHVAFRRFICLTDNEFYTTLSHRGHAGFVSIGNGQHYDKGFAIRPTWAGQWQDRTRDTDIVFRTDIEFAWRHIGGWYYLFIDV